MCIVQGLQLLEAFAGKYQNWLIRSKHLLPSSALVHRTSDSNCCSVHGGSHRFLHFFQPLASDVLAFSPLLHFLHSHYHPLTSQSKHILAVQNNHSVAPHSKYPNFFNTFFWKIRNPLNEVEKVTGSTGYLIIGDENKNVRSVGVP